MRTLIAFCTAIICCLVLIPLIRYYQLNVAFSIVVNALHTAALVYYVSHPVRNRLWVVGIWVYGACVVLAITAILMS